MPGVQAQPQLSPLRPFSLLSYKEDVATGLNLFKLLRTDNWAWAVPLVCLPLFH